MTNGTAYRLAAPAITQIRKSGQARAVWLAHNELIARTPATDLDVLTMQRMGAALVGVYDGRITPGEMAVDILEVAG